VATTADADELAAALATTACGVESVRWAEETAADTASGMCGGPPANPTKVASKEPIGRWYTG
jgi:hypothetical protein